MGKWALMLLLCFSVTSCALVGDAILDAQTGQSVLSPVAAAVESLKGSASSIAADATQDMLEGGGISDTTKGAAGTALLVALIAGVTAYRRRQKLKA